MINILTYLFMMASSFGQGESYMTGPDATARIVYDDLKSIEPEERPFIKYFSMMALTGLDKAKYEAWLRFKPFWINQMSFEKKLGMPVPVKGTGERVWRIDIRDYRWNVAAWRAVALREPFHRQPAILSTVPFLDADGKERQVNVAEAIRLISGELEDAVGFHCIPVVRFDWWFRETCETERSPSYYDLLFAQNRFLGVNDRADVVRTPQLVEKEITVPWKGGIWPADGKFYKAGSFYHKEKVKVEQEIVQSSLNNGSTKFKFVDTPKDKADWEKLFGADKIKAFNKETKINTLNGAVAIGGLDDPQKGSIVARHNRVVLIQAGFMCPGGSIMETIDTETGTGEDDYVENAHKIPLGLIKIRAQELLNSLPNGGQACLLVAGDDLERVEFAADRVATDRDKMDRRVRAPGSCFTCHTTHYGVIPPYNFVRQAFGRPGIVDNFLSKQERILFDGFFMDWEHTVEPVYQLPMKTLVERTTSRAGAKAWLGKDVAEFVMEARAWYDLPVTVEQMARETGLSVEAFKAVAVEATDINRLALAVRGVPMPRDVWDKDVYPKFTQLWALQILKSGAALGGKK